jgi:hypothetical protein
MIRDPFIHEKFTRERSVACKLAQEYFERYPKDRYQTKIERGDTCSQRISSSR